MNHPAIFPFFKISQWHILGISFPIIYLTGRHPVTEHLFYITNRHFNRFFKSCLRIVILPIFKMMFIPSLMMHPGNRITINFSLFCIGASCSLIISCTRYKFCRTILGQIMSQSLPENTCMITIAYYLMAVFCNCTKMFPYIHLSHHFSFLLSFL